MRKKPLLEKAASALIGLSRAFGAVISWCVAGCFIAAAAVSILLKLDAPVVHGLDAAAAALPSRVYTDMLSFEIARLDADPGVDSPFSTRNVASFLTRLTTGIDPADPRTLAAQLLPGAQGDSSIILIQGIGTGPADYPVEVPPAPHLMDPPAAPQAEEPDELLPSPSDEAEGEPAPQGEAGPDASPEAPSEPAPNVVFVYHSHPEESFLPELDGITEIDEAYSKTKSQTVAAIGGRLSEALERRGVGAIHSDLYYPWRGAYDESRKTVKTAMAKYEDLTYFIDIHRDAARKDKTQLISDGTAYAKLYFVVGHKNPNYEQNQALAEELHYRIEEKVKGISRGVVGKKDGSNGEFNQSLSPNSILIEFGGVDNTLEECFRTADVLAEVLSEMYWERQEAVKADAPASDAEEAPATEPAETPAAPAEGTAADAAAGTGPDA